MAPGAFLDDVEQHMFELVDASGGAIADAARTQIAAGGKRLRPLLVLAAVPSTSEGVDRAIVRAGAAVELIHTATLIHDDLLDGADKRRGVPTVGSVLGAEAAVAAGDLLFSLAFQTLTDCREIVDPSLVQRAARVLARTSRTLAEGEALQARQIRDSHLAERDYLLRCACKTGVLFAAALQIGATLAGAGEADVDALGRFGTTVGTAFQITDDVLDCGTPDVEVTLGKLPGADVRDGTVTLPMLIAVEREPALAATLATAVSLEHVEQVLLRIRETGALDAARDRAFAMRDEALELLEPLTDRFDVAPLREVAARSVDRLT